MHVTAFAVCSDYDKSRRSEARAEITDILAARSKMHRRKKGAVVVRAHYAYALAVRRENARIGSVGDYHVKTFRSGKRVIELHTALAPQALSVGVYRARFGRNGEEHVVRFVIRHVVGALIGLFRRRRIVVLHVGGASGDVGVFAAENIRDGTASGYHHEHGYHREKKYR